MSLPTVYERISFHSALGEHGQSLGPYLLITEADEDSPVIIMDHPIYYEKITAVLADSGAVRSLPSISNLSIERFVRPLMIVHRRLSHHAISIPLRMYGLPKRHK